MSSWRVSHLVTRQSEAERSSAFAFIRLFSLPDLLGWGTRPAAAFTVSRQHIRALRLTRTSRNKLSVDWSFSTVCIGTTISVYYQVQCQYNEVKNVLMPDVCLTFTVLHLSLTAIAHSRRTPLQTPIGVQSHPHCLSHLYPLHT